MPNLLPANTGKDANVTFLTSQGSVLTMATTAVVEPASKSLPVSSSGSHVSGHKSSSQKNYLSGFTLGQPAPIHLSLKTACIAGNTAFDFGIHTDTDVDFWA